MNCLALGSARFPLAQAQVLDFNEKPTCMYESRSQPLLHRVGFVKRLVLHSVGAVALLFGSLAIGIAGYAHFESLGWRDGFLNSAMLLGGMGPVDPPHSDGGKIFAGVYALYAGLIFIITVAVVLTPVIHRLFHRFHINGH